MLVIDILDIGPIPQEDSGPWPGTAGATPASSPKNSGGFLNSSRCLCAVIVDRLTFNGTIIETGTDSYRLAHTLNQQAAS